jgi:hypothetical protein
MKSNLVHALTAVGAFALAMVVSNAVQPVEAAPIGAPDCVAHSPSAAPTTHIPLVREHLAPV